MAHPEPMQQTSDIGAMHDDAPTSQLQAQLVQRRLTLFDQVLAHPVTTCIQLAATQMTLLSGPERSGLALQDHQIVDELNPGAMTRFSGFLICSTFGRARGWSGPRAVARSCT